MDVRKTITPEEVINEERKNYQETPLTWEFTSANYHVNRFVPINPNHHRTITNTHIDNFKNYKSPDPRHPELKKQQDQVDKDQERFYLKFGDEKESQLGQDLWEKKTHNNYTEDEIALLLLIRSFIGNESVQGGMLSIVELTTNFLLQACPSIAFAQLGVGLKENPYKVSKELNGDIIIEAEVPIRADYNDLNNPNYEDYKINFSEKALSEGDRKSSEDGIIIGVAKQRYILKKENNSYTFTPDNHNCSIKIYPQVWNLLVALKCGQLQGNPKFTKEQIYTFIPFLENETLRAKFIEYYLKQSKEERQLIDIYIFILHL